VILAFVVSFSAFADDADLLGPMPAVGAAVPFEPAAPAASKLANGADLWVAEDHTLPIVSVQIAVPGGSGLDPMNLSGLATLSDQMMRQGAGSRDSTEFSEIVERLAIQLDVTTTPMESSITVTCNKDKLPTALDLVRDMILDPTYSGKALKQEKALEVAYLEQGMNEPVTVAQRLGNSTWWGDVHAYAKPTDGTIAGLKAITKADALGYHTRAWNASAAVVTVAGDTTPAEITDLLDKRLGKWEATKPQNVVVPVPPAHAGGILAVDRPGSAQTMFYLVFPGYEFATTEVRPLRLGTIALGGTFTSRLNHLLREVRGYTYGVKARTVELRGLGTATIGTRIRTDATGPAIADLVGELDKIKTGITQEELDKAKGAWRQDIVEAMETKDGVVATLGEYHQFFLPPNALRTELDAMAKVDLASASAAMKAYDLSGKDYVWVMVGDRKLIEKPLADAGVGSVQWVEAR
jgi:zinc protease